jgi:flagellar motility protein MotE (MotC chaperone)
MTSLKGVSALTLAAVLSMSVSASRAQESIPEDEGLVDIAAMTTGAAATEGDLPICETSEEVLQAIVRERELLEVQKGEVSEGMAEIALAREALEVEIGRLEALREEIVAFEERSKRKYGEELDRIVAFYGNMRPEEAARLLDEMDMSVTLEIFVGMTERKVAEIMPLMNPVRARSITRILMEAAKLPGDRDLEGIKVR